jgi:hypothetical protein
MRESHMALLDLQLNDLPVTLMFVGLFMFCMRQSRRGSSHVWTTPISLFDTMTGPASINAIYPSENEPDMRSINPDYYWNRHAKASIPTYAGPSSYAFGNGETAQMTAGR